MTLKAPADECLFVTGCDRSGTTLLQNLLNAHPDVLLTYEKGFIYPFEDRFQSLGWRGVLQLAHERSLLDNPDEIDEEALRDSRADQSFAHLMAMIYRRLAKQKDKRIWGDKRPSYCLNIYRLAELFPNARFIHLVRDPRAVALSWAKTDWGPNTPYQAARAWRKRVLAARQSLARIDPARSLTLHFEDLVEDQEGVLTTACDFIGIEFQAGMMDTGKREADKLSKRMERLHPNRNQAPMKRRLGSWSTASSRVLTHIESVCYDELCEFNYQPFTEIRAETPIPVYWRAIYRLTGHILYFWRRTISRNIERWRDSKSKR